MWRPAHESGAGTPSTAFRPRVHQHEDGETEAREATANTEDAGKTPFRWVVSMLSSPAPADSRDSVDTETVSRL